MAIFNKGDNEQIKYVSSNLLDKFINLAIEKEASDIHIQPEEKEILIRLRIDGILQEVEKAPLEILNRLISRIKVLANLDISETRQPQDGRFQIEKPDFKIDIRVSTFPTVYGECAVIRLLNQAKLITSFKDLGLEDKQKQIFEKIIKKPYGLILTTGPTGAGKTATLFSILNKLNTPDKYIVTLEDPVELRLPLIRQSQIMTEYKFDFAQGLRSLFRQNPDIIMVGEIRDKKTAEIAVKAAMTGHLVLSTLHTNDSIGALIRLKEMGLEKFMINSAVIGVIAQRLVRRVCLNCRESYKPESGLVKSLGLDETKQITFVRSRGCKLCRNSGYIGRTGIFEVLNVTPEINKLVYEDASWDDLNNLAIKQGMQTLRQSGLSKALAGITSLEEVIKEV